MQLRFWRCAPVIDLRAACKPVAAAAIGVEHRLAKNGLALTKSHGFERLAIVARDTRADMILADNIALDDSQWPRDHPRPGPAHAIRSSRLHGVDKNGVQAAWRDYGID